jgi:hypothetical protein
MQTSAREARDCCLAPGKDEDEDEEQFCEPKGAIARRAGAEEEGKDRLQAREEPSVSTGW